MFQQMAPAPAAVRPPQQVLTMQAADQADLIRRAVKAANEQGLEVTLVFRPNGQVDISIRVPAERYERLVTALLDLTAPQSQSMSNTAYAQGGFYARALDNYRSQNSIRLEQQKEQGTKMAAAMVSTMAPAAAPAPAPTTDRLVTAARKATEEDVRRAAGAVSAAAAPVTNAPVAPAGPVAGVGVAVPAAARPMQEELSAMASAAQMTATALEARAKQTEAAAAGEEGKARLGAPMARPMAGQVEARSAAAAGGRAARDGGPPDLDPAGALNDGSWLRTYSGSLVSG